MNTQEASGRLRGRYAAIICGLTLALVGWLGPRAAAQTVDPSRASTLRAQCQQGDQAACRDYSNILAQCANACQQLQKYQFQGAQAPKGAAAIGQIGQELPLAALCAACGANN